MTIYIIGIGLGNEKDITINGLEAIQRCNIIYLEHYTSVLQCSKEKLEQLYHKKVFLVNRNLAEEGADHIVEEAKNKNVAFLVIGDPFSATTHIEFLKTAYYKGVPVKIINNASVLTAVGITGLQLYKFGKVTSIPFPEHVPELETPYVVLNENLNMGLHTLFLLDLNPEQNKFMTIPQAIEILEKIQKEKREKIILEETLVIGCARLGADNFVVKAGKLKDIKKYDFGSAPHCLIIPGKLHFMEEEMMELWKK